MGACFSANKQISPSASSGNKSTKYKDSKQSINKVHSLSTTDVKSGFKKNENIE